MSWLNNSFNTIKGQLTTLAQEVLAETAGPGDEEYRGPAVEKTAVELLAETEAQKEELFKLCSDQENEITKLRKQITDLQNRKISNTEDASNLGAIGQTSKSPIDNNALEDSWCWELDKPDKPDNENSSEESSGGNSSEMVNITLEESTTSKNAKRMQSQLPMEYTALQERFQKLEMENKELNSALEELDTQHNLAMQNVLELKADLQQKLSTVTKDYESLKKEQTDKFINSELEIAKLKKQLESLEIGLKLSEEDNQRMSKKIDEDNVELQRATFEIADLQGLLEKKNQDNLELIQRVKHANEETEHARIERETLNIKIMEMTQEIEELKNNFKEKKTSESSTTSSTSKHSEDEFIVVREVDANSSGPTTPPTKEELKDKIVQLENRVSELTLENGSLTLKVQERENENEIVKRALESKIQELTLHYQEMKLNAEAETEKFDNSSAELEAKLKTITEENESLRAEFESISRQKFHQVIAEEKQRITDLDADDEEEPFKLEMLHDLLDVYIKKDLSEDSVIDIEQAYRILRNRLWKIDTLEKNLAHMSEEIIELQDSKLVWDHEKKTLEADISQYILQCDELMKNNEVLLNELENLKRNKLETIPENNEENVLQLESQLDEVNKLNHTLEQEYVELTEKCEELEREKQLITEQLRATQQSNEHLMTLEKDYKMQLETLELEKSNLAFELDELKSNELSETNDERQLLEAQCENLQQQLTRLSKDHADLVAAMQAQKASLTDISRKREEAEKNLNKQESIIQSLNAELVQQKNERVNQEELQKQEIQANSIVLESLKDEISRLNKQLEELETLKITNQVLEQKLLENQEFLERLQSELQDKSTKEDNLQSELNELQKAQEYTENSETLKQELETLQLKYEELQKQHNAQCTEIEELRKKENSSTSEQDTENRNRMAKLEEQLTTLTELKANIETLNHEKNELVKGLHQKHGENVQYYNEIKRLAALVEQLEVEKRTATAPVICEKCTLSEQTIAELNIEQDKLRDQINFLKEKSDILTTNLLTEQTNQKLIRQEKAEVEEQNAAIRKDIERLREHLLEIEDMHTQETIQMQRELEETKAQMVSLQEEVSKSSTAYTSANIRANQQAETLQAQYALLVQQRDDLVAKLSSAEDRELKNQAALCNLQCALEQFQNDKEKDIKAATQRIRKELQLELDKETKLQNEIAALNQQLNDANQGLRAAARLSDQLEMCQQTIGALREEVETMKQQNMALEEKLKSSESSQADKIDKSLIKSLLIGYVVSHNQNDKSQVLRMISSVLDFTQTESDKVGLNKQHTSWLGAILGGGSGDTQGQHSKDNLIQAFVQFLEQESQPKANTSDMPNLLNITQVPTGSTTGTASSINTTVARRTSTGNNNFNAENNNSPAPIPIQAILFNSNVLNEFAPTRNSSSILKDILNDT